MILGRPTNLILGAITALLNLAVIIAGTQGYTVTPETVAAINIAAGAIIAVVANQPPTVAQGTAVNVVTPAGEANKTVTV